jgi:hypothetical protein
MDPAPGSSDPMMTTSGEGRRGPMMVGTRLMPDRWPMSEKERGCKKETLARRLPSDAHAGEGSAGSV